MTNKSMFALIATTATEPVAPQGLARVARQIFPAIPIRIEEMPDLPPQAGRIGLKLNGLRMVVISVPSAIPESSWAEPAKAAMPWPELPQAFARHRAHYVVASVNKADDHELALAHALAISILSALLCALPGSLAVYWDSAGAAGPAEALVRQTHAMLKSGDLSELPIDFWVRIRFTQDADRARIGGFTTGLAPFAGRELELRPRYLSALDAAQRLIPIARYLILKGPVIEDGATLEAAAGETLSATHAVRGRDPGVPVIVLDRQ